MRPPGEDDLERFAAVERIVHWTNAALFLLLLLTGAALYVGPLSTIVGRRELVKSVHVVAGLLLPLPLVAGLAGPWRRPLRDDVRRLNRWDGDDGRWVRRLGRDPSVPVGKFNAGQKLNAAFVAGAIVVMLATGSIMRWFSPFPDDWRTGATFVHDWVFLVGCVVVAGHIAFALGDPASLRSMIGGRVPARWARRHRAKWYAEAVGDDRAEPATPAGARGGGGA
jgi:formate dehydrogenase subunit gamma